MITKYQKQFVKFEKSSRLILIKGLSEIFNAYPGIKILIAKDIMRKLKGDALVKLLKA